jgi:sensor c-di-GMP phosphodiesterase-like protein
MKPLASTRNLWIVVSVIETIALVAYLVRHAEKPTPGWLLVEVVCLALAVAMNVTLLVRSRRESRALLAALRRQRWLYEHESFRRRLHAAASRRDPASVSQPASGGGGEHSKGPGLE